MITTLDPETEARIRRLSIALCDQLCALRAAGAHHRIPGVVQEALRQVYAEATSILLADLPDAEAPTPERWPVCSQNNCNLPAMFSYTWERKRYSCVTHTVQALAVAKAMGFAVPGATLALVIDETVRV